MIVNFLVDIKFISQSYSHYTQFTYTQFNQWLVLNLEFSLFFKTEISRLALFLAEQCVFDKSSKY